MLKKRCSRGQITVFIILGIVVVIAIGLVVVLQSEVVTLPGEDLIISDQGKVTNFIESCIDKLGTEALTKAGLQGGYVFMPEEIANDGSVHLRTTPVTIVPYWAYGTTKDIPALSQIKDDVDAYIEQGLDSCVLDQGAFTEEFALVAKSAVTADTEFTNAGTTFNVEWDVEIRAKDGELVATLQQHIVDSKVRFKRTYDTAVKIIEYELESLFFEDLTQDLLSLDHPSVPLSGLDVGCTPKTWQVSSVKSTIQDMLRVNVPQVKVEGTEVLDFPNELEYYQTHYNINLGEDFAQGDIEVTFRSDNNYPFTFQVTPTDGNILQSTSVGGTDVASPVCLQNWKFTYDLSYPVLTQIKDLDSDFTFTTAFTVHLIRNFPDRTTPLVARESRTLPTVTNSLFCDDARIPMTITTEEVVQSDEFGVFYTEPIDQTNVSFTCIRYTCDLGSTSFNYEQQGYQASFTRPLPFCVGGYLRAEKENYLGAEERVVTTEGKRVALQLVPSFTIPQAQISLQPTDGSTLPSTSLALLRITSVQERGGTPLLDETISLNGAGIAIEGFDTFTLLGKADFTYYFDVTVFANNELIGGYKGNSTLKWDDLQTLRQLQIPIVPTPTGFVTVEQSAPYKVEVVR